MTIPAYFNTAFSYSWIPISFALFLILFICSVSKSTNNVNALIFSGSLPSSWNNEARIDKPPIFRNFLVPLGNSLNNADKAYIAFFRVVGELRVFMISLVNNCSAPDSNKLACTGMLLNKVKKSYRYNWMTVFSFICSSLRQNARRPTRKRIHTI